MPVTIGHALSATTPDNTQYEIRPSNWNSAHNVTLALSGTDISGAFSNNANISFGTNAQGYITGSVNPAGGGLTNIKISAGATSENLSAITFSNSNGLAFGIDTNSVFTGSYTVPSTAGLLSNLAFSASNTTTAATGLTFSNSNGMSFGLTAGTLTGSYTVPSTAGLISGVNVSAGASSAVVSAVTFVNTNGVSWGYDKTNITGSVATNYAGTGTTFAGTNVSASATLNTAGLNFALSAAAAGGGTTASYYEMQPWRGAFSFLAGSNSIGQTTVMYMQPFVVGQALSLYRGMMLNSLSSVSSTLSMTIPISTTLANSTGSARASTTWTLALFSRVSTGTNANSSNISQFASTTMSSSIGVSFTNSTSTNASSGTASISSIFAIGFISNIDSAGGITSGSTSIGGSTSSSSTTNASSNFSFAVPATSHAIGITGARPLDFALATSLSPGEYWLGIQMASGTASGGGTAAMQNLCNFSAILYGATSNPSQMYRFGTLSNNASTTFPQQFYGSVSSAQTTTTVGVNQFTSNSGVQTWFALMAATL